MRKHYIDNIRWMTVLLVVVFHVFYIFNGVATEGVIGPFQPVQKQDAILYLLYPWFMVLLFVVSGVSAEAALRKYSPTDFLRARTRRLLVPSTLGLLVFYWIGGYLNMQISGAYEELAPNVPAPILYLVMAVSGTGVLWYIQVLWIFSLLLLLVRRLDKGRLRATCAQWHPLLLLLFVVPLWASAQVLNTPVIVCYRFGIYGFAFFLGYFIFSQEALIERLSRTWAPLSLAAVVAGIAYTTARFGDNFAIPPAINSPLAMLFCWLAVLAAFATSKHFLDFTNASFQWFGQRSFGLYVFHYMTLAAAALWICDANDLGAVASYSIAAVAAFVGGYGLNALISRIPVLRTLVLGMKKG